MTDPVDRIEVLVGDITRLRVDAIVNAANESLLGGGGVDGAIHSAAGPRLLEHNRTLGGCPTGLAKATPAFDLDATGIRHIFHTVGPYWHHDEAAAATKLGDLHDDVLLASCYTQCLALAVEHRTQSLAFPAISTGIFRFPKPRAARIAIGHVHGHLLRNELPLGVIFCCYSEPDAEVYRDALATRSQWMYNRKRG
jgi:O-acetyl-ADP-ribose deacetylase (regulator of RNase III)